MKFNQITARSQFRLFGFRFVACYLLFYFLFLSDFFVYVFPFVETLHKPFKYLSDGYVGIINRLFVYKNYDANVYTGIGDTSWFYLACVVFLFTALLTALLWTLLGKHKHDRTLFIVIHTCSRYYLAFVMMVYGVSKLFETQFPEPPPDYLMQPLGNIDSHTLLWAFMGASKSYNYFGGLLETVAGLLLFFRRTTVLGALLSIAIATQVLFLNIGYDTLVKILVVHLLLLSLFILSPAMPSLLNFFLSKRSEMLPLPPTLTVKPYYRWMTAVAKALLIGVFCFGLLKQQVKVRADIAKPYYSGIDGIYETTEFIRNKEVLPPLTTDAFRWRRLAVSKFGYIAVQFMNDSTAQYGLQIDTTTRTMDLQAWGDSTFKSRLHYSNLSDSTFMLDGIFMDDSIKMVARKKNISTLPLLKDKGKVKWVWW